ncbi:haloacid dehalogenase-like hydrolase [Mycobacterium sp. CBMA293]|uniref:HAD family hydrolase n=1 Tax=unclassified Mycolicibacterium TaxID=2636767 RepID=UPI001328054B|nr:MULTISPECIES: HAD family hydrolase [unclassified Mycolicibacterium]MUL45814.1 haloacid dehalogenase-like hydrolase [Mycolicibacterium sp. CBMA 360]MUL95298.1 haloacid dehalogenase-like hydrolase [Mycolicibacterium sp. CBMA 230]MUM33563.1 haloacid dehalogenase-like hydrolase [Mycolicibacterium sp. CBMA 361]MUL60486.1 haloacid dehalogenase-like hydrolase [Mycolicibacterium sp. CBMA 335]MUL72301.1 haloacid dehalogenase-like hydrolase [Mycolicibacterium sp. CBMA 311]
MLELWNDGPTKSAIVDFVGRVTTPGADYVAPQDRIAVFDNDGTLWCEKPAYIQLDFLVRRLAAQAATDPELAARQPYTAAATGDLAWFGAAVTKHYDGDDDDLKLLGAAVLSAHSGITVDEHAARVAAFFAENRHPTLNRPYTSCGYVPMIELLHYLESNGFTCYIVSGGGRDFMRPVTADMYGIPPERVIGSSVALQYQNGELLTTDQLEFLDDGPIKPVRIWGRIGRRPIFAAGNSNGDIEMLQYTKGFQLLVQHDDTDREFAYAAGAERALDVANTEGWTVASMQNDWAEVFPR